MPKYKVNDKAVAHAKRLIKDGKVAKDVRDDWSEHAPSAEKGSSLLEKEGLKEYSLWHLAIDPEQDSENKGAYAFPYGDFRKVHRGAVIAAKVRASQYDHDDVRKATDELLELIDSED